jgi:hypothetical protein
VLGDDVTEELSPGEPEGAFFWVQLNVEPPEAVDGFFQVSDEAIAPSRFDYDVINIDFLVAPYLPVEAEWHFHVAETTEGGDECGGGLVHLR